MKTRGLFLSALLMGAVWAGCSQDEVLNDVQQERKVVQEESYVSIKIVAPKDASSRAVTDGGFKAGLAEENAVNDLVLVFFDANGNYYDAQSSAFNWSEVNETSTANIASSSSVVVVFEGKQVKPASFIALLNTGKAATSFANMSLSQVTGEITNYYSTSESTNYFVMSNSVFVNGNGKIQVAAPIADNQICASEDAAKANPVTAYVERVAVKLQATATANVTATGKEVTMGDGTKVTLTPTITGMKFVHTNPTSWLLKDITGFDATAPFTGWNDPGNFRSYWANSYGSNTTNHSYNIYSYKDAIANGPSALTEYANENTSATPTKLLVTATISADVNGTPTDTYKYKGYYYTLQMLKDEVGKALKDRGLKYTLNGAEGNDWASYLTVTNPEGVTNGVEHYEGVIGIDPDAGITVDETTAKAIAELEKPLWWKDGRCYFYVPVEHLASKVGIVRNHWYLLDVTSVSGLGTPVADEDEPIIPTIIEDQTYYVAAQIHILKWKMISQSVSLGE